jgi:hypothetical protein
MNGDAQGWVLAAYGVVIGGPVAEAVGDAFLLFSGGIAIGGFVGAATSWLAGQRARRSRGATRGGTGDRRSGSCR